MGPRKAPAASAAPVADADWECPECAQENEASDDLCIACEEPRPAGSSGGDGEDGPYAGYKIALILDVEDVPGKKLRVVRLDIGKGPDNAIKVLRVRPYLYDV